MIEISDVEFAYGHGDFRLQIGQLEVAEGVKTALIGPSGSGKTTFLNLVSGTMLPLTGSVRVDGREVSSMTDAVRREFRITNIGFVFQDFELSDVQPKVAATVGEVNLVDFNHGSRATGLRSGPGDNSLFLAQVDGCDPPPALNRLDREHGLVLVDPSVDMAPVPDRTGSVPPTVVDESA